MRTRVEKRERIGSTVQGAAGTLAPYRAVPPSITMSAFAVIWQRFLRTLIGMLDLLVNNDMVLLSYWQPGDVKFSLRQPHDEMPGFVYWKKVTLSRQEFQALWRVVGNGDSESDADDFSLPDPAGRLVQIVGQNEKSGNPGVIEIVSNPNMPEDVNVIRLTAWVKT